MTEIPAVLDALSRLRILGWPVHVVGDQLMLQTVTGLCGIEVSKDLGKRILDRLVQSDLAGPVTEMYRPAPRHLFLAESDIVLSPSRIHHVGRLWQSPDEIALPPSKLPSGRMFWVVQPRPVLFSLPRLSTVLWALDEVAPQCRPSPRPDRVPFAR